MNDPWASIQQEVQLHPDFLQGRRYVKQGDWASALGCFKAADQAASGVDVYANLYMSYLGLAQVQLNDVSGLNLCRRAAAEERVRGDVFENLARAELKLGHRKQACEAVRRGLRIESGHTGLRDLRLQMGIRRTPVLSFLGRDNPLNRFLGKLTYRPRRGGPRGR
ncbi:MAG: hypothetical protein LOY58_02575 [Gammaproteobacteria bacterium]|nr:hypothetical protein [Gammaproteobacteria bacterium]